MLKRLKTVTENIAFEDEFISNLKQFVDQRDMNTYGWLIHRSAKMQNTMGSYGIFTHFRLPYANYSYQNYQIITNIIPLIQQNFVNAEEAFTTHRYGIENQAYNYTNMVHEAILRHIGVLEDEKEKLENDIKNPLSIFRNGMQSILRLPFLILFSFGLLNRQKYDSTLSSGIYKVGSSIFSLMGFIGMIVGLVTGWEQFVKIIRSIIG